MRAGSPVFTPVLNLHMVFSGSLCPSGLTDSDENFIYTNLARTGGISNSVAETLSGKKGFPPDWVEEAVTQLNHLQKGGQGG